VEKLPGEYIAGFVDGEGCFALKFIRSVRHDRKNKPVYFYWDIEFIISLKDDDAEIIESIKHTLGCGRISYAKKGIVRYSVNDINELSALIIPFFQKNRLYAKKRHDFELWKEAVQIFKRNQSGGGINKSQKKSWDPGDLQRLQMIHQQMRVYKASGRIAKWLK